MADDSALLTAARIVLHDANLRDRVKVALIAGGYHAADFDQLLTWVLASSDLPGLLGKILDDAEVQAILAATPALKDPGTSLASLVEVKPEGPALAPTYRITSSVIPDALIIAGIRAAYEQRSIYGLPITRHTDTTGGA